MALTKDQYNGYARGGLGVLGLTGQWLANAHRNDNINTQAPSESTDINGKPQYNLGNFSNQINGIDTSGNSAGQVINDVGQGVSAGASIGSAIPGLGTLAGGLIGGGVAAIGSFISGGEASRAAKRRKAIAQQSLMAAQRTYNAHAAQYTNQQLGQQAYMDEQNPEARMYNLYKFTTPYS